MKTFEIYDPRQSMLKDFPVVEAETSRQAIEKHLFGSGITVRRSGSNSVQFSTQPFYVKNGYKYADGRKTWYKVV